MPSYMQLILKKYSSHIINITPSHSLRLFIKDTILSPYSKLYLSLIGFIWYKANCLQSLFASSSLISFHLYEIKNLFFFSLLMSQNTLSLYYNLHILLKFTDAYILLQKFISSAHSYFYYIISAESHINFMSHFCNIKVGCVKPRWLLTNPTFN